MFYIIYYNVYYSLVSVAILFYYYLQQFVYCVCLFYSERSIIMFRVLFSVGETGTDRTQKMRWNNY
jgi:hypothetical protein